MRLENGTPVWGITSRIVCEVVWAVVSSVIRQAILDIVRRVVSAITCRSHSSIVSQGIRSGARQVAAGVTAQPTRPAVPHIARHVILPVVPLVVRDIAGHGIPQFAVGYPGSRTRGV